MLDFLKSEMQATSKYSLNFKKKSFDPKILYLGNSAFNTCQEGKYKSFSQLILSSG